MIKKNKTKNKKQSQNKQQQSHPKGSHLTLDERIIIESGLNEGLSINKIAQKLNISPSTVSREIERNSVIKKGHLPKCQNIKRCRVMKLCNPKCTNSCKACEHIDCTVRCDQHVTPEGNCPNKHIVCNSCKNRNNSFLCTSDKKIYSAKSAEDQARIRNESSRKGFNLTGGQFARIDETATPLLKQGQSPYVIISSHPELGISVQTLYRLIAHGELQADNFSLRCKVNRKPRKGLRVRKMNREIISRIKKGRKYEDYLTFIETYDGPVVQMDTVIGKRDEGASLLTLHMPPLHFQMAMMLNEHTSEAVVGALDTLETVLGDELFKTVFPVLLTDNGSEFMDIQGMERSCTNPKKQRTKIFFCEPNRSDQKGAAENNHKYIRYVIPKSTSLEPYTQDDINLMFCHINSYPRKSLYGRTPFELARSVLPEDFFTLMGYSEIPTDQVNLRPSLLKNRISQR